MKHTPRVTVIIVLIFLLSQAIGLLAVNGTTIVSPVVIGNETYYNVTYGDTALGERPAVEGFSAFLYMMVAIGIGTGLILVMVKLGLEKVWKGFYFFAVWMTCFVALSVFIPELIALSLAFAMAFLKLFKSNPWTHNASELFIYAGIAVIFVPLLDIFWVIALLLAISAYDAFAVWQSGHMVTMAKFQTKSKAFAGISIDYKLPEKQKKAGKPEKGGREKPGEPMMQSAILGGGDIAFPLLFAGVAMTSLIKTAMISQTMAFLYAMVIPVTVAIALFTLLAMAKKNRFYPAMPFLTAGCLAGYGIMLLLAWF